MVDLAAVALVSIQRGSWQLGKVRQVDGRRIVCYVRLALLSAPRPTPLTATKPGWPEK